MQLKSMLLLSFCSLTKLRFFESIREEADDAVCNYVNQELRHDCAHCTGWGNSKIKIYVVASAPSCQIRLSKVNLTEQLTLKSLFSGQTQVPLLGIRVVSTVQRQGKEAVVTWRSTLPRGAFSSSVGKTV